MSLLDRHLAAMEAAGLVRPAPGEPEPTFRFRHALIQDTAYGSLLKGVEAKAGELAGSR